jgi:hypothetical protein
MGKAAAPKRANMIAIPFSGEKRDGNRDRKREEQRES